MIQKYYHYIITIILVSIISSNYSYAQVVCTADYNPVCGTDSKTYTNSCVATTQGATIAYAGECKSGNQLDQALAMAYQFGITKYNTLENFKPETFVTREQIAKMLLQFAKAFGYTGTTISTSCNFTDLNTTDPTLTNFILDTCKQGMLKGWNNAFHPQDTVNYAQAITMLMRIVQGQQVESEQWWDPYEKIAIKQGYITTQSQQPLLPLSRGELIILMNKIYNKKTAPKTIYEIWSIADTTKTCSRSQALQCLRVTHNNTTEEIVIDGIEGFSYVSGYNYTLQVSGEPQNETTYNRKLIAIQGYTSTTGKPDTLPQSGCDRIKIDNTILTVRGQRCNENRNFATISYDDKLPGVTLTTKNNGISTQVPVIHIFSAPSSTGLQSLLFTTHSTMIKQGLISKTADCIFSKNIGVIGSRIDRYDFISNGTGTTNCGAYGYNNGITSYFVKPKDIFTKMIYINNAETIRAYIDRSTLLIK